MKKKPEENNTNKKDIYRCDIVFFKFTCHVNVVIIFYKLKGLMLLFLTVQYDEY